MTAPKIPVGIDDFKEIRTKHLYYVDKTHMIREFWDDSSNVLLLPRPRRFGKSLNLSMLRYFFEQSEEDHRYLFEGLSVAQQEDLMVEQGQYPVLYLNFKSIKASSWEDALYSFRDELYEVCLAYRPLIPDAQWLTFEEFRKIDAPVRTVEVSLLKLCKVLHQVTGKPVIVFIDEYDVPLIEAWLGGYYEEMSKFLRNLSGSLLKTNTFLKKALLTGILRVTKESIFSDLNHLEVYSLLNPEFSTCFGFTEEEISRLLNDCAMDSAHQQQLQDWYNGYLFGGKIIYNPWSVLEYVKRRPPHPEPYWANTSANELVRQLILEESDQEIQNDVETLLNGQPLERFFLNDQIALRDVRRSRHAVWNLLTFSGYLKPINPQWDEVESLMVYDLVPPNKEVMIYYRQAVRSWLSRQLGESPLKSLLDSLRDQNWDHFRSRFQNIVFRSLSFHDTAQPNPEKFYHGLFLGMLLHLHDYQVRSNRESGQGQYDVMLQPQDPQKPGFLFEFKKIDSEQKESPEEAMQTALGQIQKMKYATELKAQGVKEITGIGVVVRGKEVWVESIQL